MLNNTFNFCKFSDNVSCAEDNFYSVCLASNLLTIEHKDNYFSSKVLSSTGVTLHGSIGGGYYIIIPFNIDICIDGNLYIASEDIFNMYGDGDSISEALDDYKRSLVEFINLTIHSVNQNKYDKQVLEKIFTFIENN